MNYKHCIVTVMKDTVHAMSGFETIVIIIAFLTIARPCSRVFHLRSMRKLAIKEPHIQNPIYDMSNIHAQYVDMKAKMCVHVAHKYTRMYMYMYVLHTWCAKLCEAHQKYEQYTLYAHNYKQHVHITQLYSRLCPAPTITYVQNITMQHTCTTNTR